MFILKSKVNSWFSLWGKGGQNGPISAEKCVRMLCWCRLLLCKITKTLISAICVTRPNSQSESPLSLIHILNHHRWQSSTCGQRRLAVGSMPVPGEVTETLWCCDEAGTTQPQITYIQINGCTLKYMEEWPHTRRGVQKRTRTKPSTHSFVSFHASGPSFLTHCVSH